MLESVVYRLNVLLVVLGSGDIGSGRDTARTVTGQSVSGHAAVYNTLARNAGDVGDTGNGGTVLANRR